MRRRQRPWSSRATRWTAAATTSSSPARRSSTSTRSSASCGSRSSARTAATPAPRTATSPRSGSRHYCLYVRYAEELADPVAPYATEEPCGHQACEPSRVHEGFRFLLRCDQHRTPRDSLQTRVLACLPPEKDDDAAKRIERLDRFGRPLLAAARTADAPVAAPDVKLIAQSQQALAALTKRGQGAPELPADVARSMTEHVRTLASALAGFDLQDDATRAQLAKDHPDLDLDQARATLAGATQALDATVDRAYDDRMDREEARTLLRQAALVAAPGPAPLAPLESRILAQGQAFGAEVWKVLLDDQAALKEWLLDRLDKTPDLSDCELRTLVAAIPVTPPEERDVKDRLAVRRTGMAAEQLTEAVRRYAVDCVCAAVNPPCVPCTDTDVLVAAWRCGTARWCGSATPAATTCSAGRRCGTGCRPSTSFATGWRRCAATPPRPRPCGSWSRCWKATGCTRGRCPPSPRSSRSPPWRAGTSSTPCMTASPS